MKRALALLWFCSAAFAQPEKWPAALAADVASQNWAAAERVGQAITEEIGAGRMFRTFADVAEEAKIRAQFAGVLEHNGKPGQARAQRCMARQITTPVDGAECATQAAIERERRVAGLKAEVLASEVNVRAAFPFAGRGRVTVVAFSAAWCAPCVKELDQLRHFSNPGARVVMLDVDQLSSSEKRSYVPLQSLMGAEVPRLYVIDRLGNIRFAVAGFEDDGRFLEKLDWMVAAAQ